MPQRRRWHAAAPVPVPVVWRRSALVSNLPVVVATSVVIPPVVVAWRGRPALVPRRRRPASASTVPFSARVPVAVFGLRDTLVIPRVTLVRPRDALVIPRVTLVILHTRIAARPLPCEFEADNLFCHIECTIALIDPTHHVEALARTLPPSTQEEGKGGGGAHGSGAR